jgi:uncharacterized membrane protein YedE/YeeE
MLARTEKHMNPYLAGVLLGLILVASIYIAGRGLGASGAIKSSVIATISTLAPAHAESTPYIQEYVNPEHSPLRSWLVFEVLGMLIGGFISGLISGRLGIKIDKGPSITNRTRLIFAFAGGLLFAFGAQFARGCTSGAALSGMGVLATGGFIAMLGIFGSGYIFAFFAKKLWK